MTEDKQNDAQQKGSLVLWIVLSVLMMILSATFFFTYTFPGGEASLSSFILIWLKEIIGLAFLVILLISLLIKKTKVSLVSKQPKN